ncbi:MAG: sulfatase-like hydrolase/transferase [Planctomycetota bacterium]
MLSARKEDYEHARERPGVRRSAAGRLWLYNVGIGCLVGTNYLSHVPDDPKQWLFALPALVSSVLFLTLLPGGLVSLAAHLVDRPRVLGLLQASLWTVFLTLLFADTRIYNIFQYHFNGQVLNLIYTRGSEDAIHLGWQVWTTIAGGMLGMGAFQHLLWRRALRFAVEDDVAPAPRRLLVRPAFVWSAVLLPAVFVEKTLYAQADLSRDQQVKALSRVFPAYPALPVETVATELLGVDIERRPKVELEGVAMQYPLVRPEIDADGPRPNILLLVVDCLRHDMVNAEAAPNVEAFARESRRFEDHLSGGNSTRFGMLSMLYGLHGSYWFPILEEGTSPVLVDSLLDLGYEMGIFSTASQNYPELRDTAWSRIPDRVFDQFPSREAWKRDEESSAALIEWLEERAEEPDEPFFGFLLLDSPHQTYSHPPESTPFTPSAPDLDYMTMTQNEGPDPESLLLVYNRYRNAVHHADARVGLVLDSIERLGLADDTVIIVTGDHGEEFRECGFFGHTSAYTQPQVHVPFLMRGPGIEPGLEARPTSHLDVPATLLEMLGADPTAREQWTLGGNLFAPIEDRCRVVSGWNELGVWVPGSILRVPLSGYAFDIEVYDYRWNLIPEDQDILADEAEELTRVAAECNRFLR